MSVLVRSHTILWPRVWAYWQTVDGCACTKSHAIMIEGLSILVNRRWPYLHKDTHHRDREYELNGKLSMAVLAPSHKLSWLRVWAYWQTVDGFACTKSHSIVTEGISLLANYRWLCLHGHTPSWPKIWAYWQTVDDFACTKSHAIMTEGMSLLVC